MNSLDMLTLYPNYMSLKFLRFYKFLHRGVLLCSILESCICVLRCLDLVALQLLHAKFLLLTFLGLLLTVVILIVVLVVACSV